MWPRGSRRTGAERIALAVVAAASVLARPSDSALLGRLDQSRAGNALAGAAGAGASTLSTGQHAGRGYLYTRDPICLPRFCINPIFPGLMQFEQNVLDNHTKRPWYCADTNAIWRLSGICSRIVVGYHFALPGDEPGSDQEDLTLAQARKALTAYASHLTGMGYDFWDYTEPWKHDECIQSVWKMSCYTHFPRCHASGRYLRPCTSSCESYVHNCKVQCCDEGVQCVFMHETRLYDGNVLVEEGYDRHHGPSPLCTGGAAGASATLWLGMLAVVLRHLAALPAL